MDGLRPDKRPGPWAAIWPQLRDWTAAPPVGLRLAAPASPGKVMMPSQLSLSAARHWSWYRRASCHRAVASPVTASSSSSAAAGRECFILAATVTRHTSLRHSSAATQPAPDYCTALLRTPHATAAAGCGGCRPGDGARSADRSPITQRSRPADDRPTQGGRPSARVMNLGNGRREGGMFSPAVTNRVDWSGLKKETQMLQLLQEDVEVLWTFHKPCPCPVVMLVNLFLFVCIF